MYVKYIFICNVTSIGSYDNQIKCNLRCIYNDVMFKFNTHIYNKLAITSEILLSCNFYKILS